MPISNIFLPESGMQILPLAGMFVSPQPVEIDLGCGKGGFLLARARAHPETNFLGVERLFKRVQKVDGKITAAGLTNVRLLRVECMHAVENMLPGHAIRAAYIFFPDPWPKRRHNRRRLFSRPFVEALSKVLTPGGIVHVMTDHLDYFEHIRGVFAGCAGFEPVPFPMFPREEHTDFEKVFEKLGRPIGRAAFRTCTRVSPQSCGA